MKIAASTLLLIPMIGSSLNAAQNLDQLKRDFETIYQHKGAVSQKNDVDGILGQTTADFQVRLRNGQALTRQQLKDSLNAFIASKQLLKQVSFEYVIKEVKRAGDDVEVVVEQRDKRIQVRRDGKPHEIEANVIHKDRWTHTSEGWKLKLTEEGEQTKFTVDGKAPKPKAG